MAYLMDRADCCMVPPVVVECKQLVWVEETWAERSVRVDTGCMLIRMKLAEASNEKIVAL